LAVLSRFGLVDGTERVIRSCGRHYPARCRPRQARHQVLAVAQAAGQRLVLLHQRPGATGGLWPRPGPRRGTDGPGAASAPRFPAFPPWLAASRTTHCLVGIYENEVAALRHRLRGGRGIRPGYGQLAESASNPQTSDPASPGTGHGRAQHGRACEHAEGQGRTPEKAPSFGRLDAQMTIRSWRRSLMSCTGDRPTHQDHGGARDCHRRERRRDHLVLRVSRSSREGSAFAAHFLLAGRQ